MCTVLRNVLLALLVLLVLFLLCWCCCVRGQAQYLQRLQAVWLVLLVLATCLPVVSLVLLVLAMLSFWFLHFCVLILSIATDDICVFSSLHLGRVCIDVHNLHCAVHGLVCQMKSVLILKHSLCVALVCVCRCIPLRRFGFGPWGVCGSR